MGEEPIFEITNTKDMTIKIYACGRVEGLEHVFGPEDVKCIINRIPRFIHEARIKGLIMLTITFLIILSVNVFTIHEMPSMESCEAIAKGVQAMRPAAKVNCLEVPV